MITVRTAEEVRTAVGVARERKAVVGFVPTMGYLHEGHLSLVDRARKEGASFVVVSIFVNPTQFGPGEDFERYPRDETRDAHLLETRGVDLLFAPRDTTEIYAQGDSTAVTVAGVAKPLEGERRPGHFAGVATVVAKLFNIVQPHLAVFGRKDAQQCAVVRRMVADLAFPIRIVTGEIIRESDGLAMSSRNNYLSSDDRVRALALRRALLAGRDSIARGERDVAIIEREMTTAADEPGVEIDYLRLVDPDTFESPTGFDRGLLLAGAIRVGRTRLIDNIEIPAPVDSPSRVSGAIG